MRQKAFCSTHILEGTCFTLHFHFRDEQYFSKYIFASKYHLMKKATNYPLILLEKAICLVFWSEMIRQILNPHICKQQYIAIHNWVSRHTSINWLIYKQRCSMTKWDLGILQKNWIISSYYLEEQGTYIYFSFARFFNFNLCK